MTLNDEIRDEKLQHGIKITAAKISALLCKRIDKYEFLTGEEILPLNKRGMIEQAKFAYFPYEKLWKKNGRATKKKQVKALTEDELESIVGRFPKNVRDDGIKNEKDQIKKLEDKIKRKDLKYEEGKYKYDFRQYQTIRSFGEIFW